jgi:hypothetical protein
MKWLVQSTVARNLDINSNQSFLADQSNSVNAFIFMIFLVCGTLEVILFKTMFAMDLVDSEANFHF